MFSLTLGLFEDMQLVKLQETPGESKDGETPHSVTLHVWNDLVDVAKPGDRVFITGVYRAVSGQWRADLTKL